MKCSYVMTCLILITCLKVQQVRLKKVLKVTLYCFLPLTLASAEAHEGAPRGGERAALPPPRLQQGFHHRPLPAATHQGHPHRWGPPDGRGGAFGLTDVQPRLQVQTFHPELVRVFSEERNYICDQCGQTFKQRKHLFVHQLRHTGAKPLQ